MSFFQLEHEVDINLYLTEATTLRHSKVLAWNHIDVFHVPVIFWLPGL